MEKIISMLVSTVIFLFAGNPPIPIGTGFILGYNHPEKQGVFFPLVVTAKHVIGDHDLVFGRFSTQEGKSTAFVEYNIRSLKASNDYWEHVDSGVDIVVFRSMHFSVTKYNSFPTDLIASKKIFQDEMIQESDRIIFPSLLRGFMGTSKNYPVLRDGSIALIPHEEVPLKYKVGCKEINTKQELILLNATSVPGVSGSPIFLWPGPRSKGNTYNMGGTKPYLLGVMHGFYTAPREIEKIQTTETKEIFAENSDIAIIFPSWRVKEIIESDIVRKRISELVESEKIERRD